MPQSHSENGIQAFDRDNDAGFVNTIAGIDDTGLPDTQRQKVTPQKHQRSKQTILVAFGVSGFCVDL